MHKYVSLKAIFYLLVVSLLSWSLLWNASLEHRHDFTRERQVGMMGIQKSLLEDGVERHRWDKQLLKNQKDLYNSLTLLAFKQSNLKNTLKGITERQLELYKLSNQFESTADTVGALMARTMALEQQLLATYQILEGILGGYHDAVVDSVVGVWSHLDDGQLYSRGSGVIIRSEVIDGQAITWVLTAKHVITYDQYGTDEEGNPFETKYLNGRITFYSDKELAEELEYEIAHFSSDLDLALLRVYDSEIRNTSNILAKTPHYTIKALVVGFPNPYPNTPTVTEGLFSGESYWDGEEHLLHISAFVNYGNSGGGAFEMTTGDLLGIIVRFSYGSTGSFVPVEQIHEFLDRIEMWSE